MFSVKDKDFLGYNNQYIGEAFIHFKDVPENPYPITDMTQVHLQLQRPTDLSMRCDKAFFSVWFIVASFFADTDAVKALEHRQGDKLAKEFVRKYKQRMDAT